MGKKCIICDAGASYKIKDSIDFYCKDCALENFGDLQVLLDIEQEAMKLKKMVDSKLAPQEEEECEQGN